MASAVPKPRAPGHDVVNWPLSREKLLLCALRYPAELVREFGGRQLYGILSWNADAERFPAGRGPGKSAYANGAQSPGRTWVTPSCWCQGPVQRPCAWPSIPSFLGDRYMDLITLLLYTSIVELVILFLGAALAFLARQRAQINRSQAHAGTACASTIVVYTIYNFTYQH